MMTYREKFQSSLRTKAERNAERERDELREKCFNPRSARRRSATTIVWVAPFLVIVSILAPPEGGAQHLGRCSRHGCRRFQSSLRPKAERNLQYGEGRAFWTVFQSSLRPKAERNAHQHRLATLRKRFNPRSARRRSATVH